MRSKLKLSQLIPTDAYKYFWEFAYYRNSIFEERILNSHAKSQNKILSEYKFTNIYRVLDRTTQFLIKNIVNNDENYSDEDLLFRILFFKVFNKIETWESVETLLGDIKWSDFSIERYFKAFERVRKKNTIYSAAYIMPTRIGEYNNQRKYKNHIYLLSDIMSKDLLADIHNCNSLKEVYETLLAVPSFGKFLAYQFSIDINYSRLIDFDENDFVVAGPGALRGIKKAFKNHNDFEADEIIRWVTDNQSEEMIRFGYEEFGLRSRKLKLVDVQNIFCEFDKYTRVSMNGLKNNTIKFNDGMRIKQRFKPNLTSIDYVYPKKWGKINIE